MYDTTLPAAYCFPCTQFEKVHVAGGDEEVVVNDKAFDVLVSGFTTVICAVPAAAISPAAIAAESWPELTNVVVRLEPFQRTKEAVTKFEPFTVSEKLGPPAVAVAGARDAAEGSGLLDCGVSWITLAVDGTPFFKRKTM